MKIYNDFSAKEMDELRSRVREAKDPDELLAVFPSLKLKQGYRLVTAHGRGLHEGSLSIVWAIPVSNYPPKIEECELINIFKLSRPFDIWSSCFDGMVTKWEDEENGEGPTYEILKPLGALDDLMDAIEGDQTPWSYLSASIFAREAAEFQPRWHAQIWRDYFILNDNPFNYPTGYFDGFDPPLQSNENTCAFGLKNFKTKPMPLTWNPAVIFNDKVITVRFYTFKFMGMEEIHCFTDTYGPEGYKFNFNYETIWRGRKGAVR